MDIIVPCGNGGDWEWSNDHYLWTLWIIQNVTETSYATGTDGCEADQLCIRFENPHHATIFSLTRPYYITFNDINFKNIV